MNCTPLATVLFVYSCLSSGVSAALVTYSLRTYTPLFTMAMRTLFGFLVIALIIAFRALFDTKFRSIAREQFWRGPKDTFLIALYGLFNTAIPYTLMAIAQQWIPSSAAQAIQPLSAPFCALISHFILPREKFTSKKVISLIISVVGVSLTTIPSFLHPSEGSGKSLVILGMVLLLIGVIFHGFSYVYLEWKAPRVDSTITAFWQMLLSMVAVWIVFPAYDGLVVAKNMFTVITFRTIMHPLILGLFVSGMGTICTINLIGLIGPVGAQFTSFGQIIIGIIVGVSFLSEWNGYAVWEIAINIVGVLLLCVGIGIQFSGGQPEGYEEVDIDLESQTLF